MKWPVTGCEKFFQVIFDGSAESMFMAAKYTILLAHYKLMMVNKQAWACAAFVALMRVMQSKYGTIGKHSIHL